MTLPQAPIRIVRVTLMIKNWVHHLPTVAHWDDAAIQYQSGFISDRGQDDVLDRRLHEKRRGAKLRAWFVSEDMPER